MLLSFRLPCCPLTQKREGRLTVGRDEKLGLEAFSDLSLSKSTFRNKIKPQSFRVSSRGQTFFSQNLFFLGVSHQVVLPACLAPDCPAVVSGSLATAATQVKEDGVLD